VVEGASEVRTRSKKEAIAVWHSGITLPLPLPFASKAITMDFLGSWRRKKTKNDDLEESTVLFEEEEGLLGGGRSPRTSPPLETISTNPAKERLTRTRLLIIIAVLCVCLAGVVYYRTHGSPIALAGLVSLKSPGCFNDFRGKPLLKSPVTKKYRGSSLYNISTLTALILVAESVVPDQKYLTSFPSGTFCRFKRSMAIVS
jgi:hypothetical protein